MAALATPLAAALPTLLARSLKFPLREAALARDGRRAREREVVRDRGFRRFEMARARELALRPELLPGLDGARREELPLERRLEAERLLA
ncbi:MAG: hypothetical protein ACJ76S_08345 [Solirubrobacteraceae bacterium]